MAKITIDTEKVTPAVYVVVLVLAFAVFALWQRVSALENGARLGATGVGGTGTVAGTGTGGGHEPANGKLSESQAGRLSPVSREDDYIRGNRDAKVFLVEYSDLECPFCQRFHATAEQAVEEFGGDVAWVYRHFPLDTIHPRAQAAALGAECAGSLGGNDAFWAFTDAVFADQNTALRDLPQVAANVGLDRGAFEGCVEDGSLASNVDSDYSGGLTAGVTGTPGNFVVNSKGEVWSAPGAIPYAQLEAILQEALDSAG